MRCLSLDNRGFFQYVINASDMPPKCQLIRGRVNFKGLDSLPRAKVLEGISSVYKGCCRSLALGPPATAVLQAHAVG